MRESGVLLGLGIVGGGDGGMEARRGAGRGVELEVKAVELGGATGGGVEKTFGVGGGDLGESDAKRGT